LSEWSFGPQVSASDNTLVGVVVTTGTAEPCPDGVGFSKVAVYGEPCQAVNEFVAQCRPEDACKNNPKDMEEYCSLFECPRTLDDIGLRLCDDFDEGGSIVQRESSCGGVTVTMDSIYFSERSYHFDADGHLVGIVPPHSSYTSACPVGRQCDAPYHPSTSLCHPARCDAAPLESWCSGLSSCPEADSPEALQQLCAAGDTLERFASSCGGSVYRSGWKEWSFDEAGKLVGVVLTWKYKPRCASGGYSEVHVFGEPCEAVGESVDQCAAGDSSPAP
jgi:hypothetical protein